MDDGVASPFADNAAVEPRTRPNLGPSRAASNESLCGRAVDGVSAVRSDRTSDHYKLRDDSRFPATQGLLVPPLNSGGFIELQLFVSVSSSRVFGYISPPHGYPENSSSDFRN